jgi:small subunit ribosomal protein S3
MGQKVHPSVSVSVSSRSITSNWYASPKNYADYLITDLKVREFLRKKLECVGQPYPDRASGRTTPASRSTTARPGIVIGKKGEDVEKLRKRNVGQV